MKGSSRSAQTTKTSPLTTAAALTIPDEGSGVLVPSLDRLFEPLDDLLSALGMLTTESPTDDDALDGFSHVEPRPPDRGIERHDTVIEEPLNQISGQVASQIVQDQDDAQRRQG